MSDLNYAPYARFLKEDGTKVNVADILDGAYDPVAKKIKVDAQVTAQIGELEVKNDSGNPIPTIGVGNSNLLQGNVTLTGAAQQLNTDQACKVVTIQAEPDNAGYVYVGKAGVSSTAHMFTLTPGSSITITCSNLNLLYVNGSSGDKVCYGGEA